MFSRARHLKTAGESLGESFRAISIVSRIGRFPIHSLINECFLDCKAISLYTLLYKHVGRSEAVSDVFCAIRDTEAHVVTSFLLLFFCFAAYFSLYCPYFHLWHFPKWI